MTEFAGVPLPPDLVAREHIASGRPAWKNRCEAKVRPAVPPSGPLPERTRHLVGSNLDYSVVHGFSEVTVRPAVFVLVKNAGTRDADGVYRFGTRRWCEWEVLENRHEQCMISREGQRSKSGKERFGFVLGRQGQPLYGVPCEHSSLPSKGWKIFQGAEPVPEVKSFSVWSDCCQEGALYFLECATIAGKGCHWETALTMADRAYDCHVAARPKGRLDGRPGGDEWSEQMCEVLAVRADALVHMGEFKRALVDACAAVHFIAPFEWSKARVRGVSACMNLGVSEAQAKVLMETACLRNDRQFLGVQQLAPWVDTQLKNARGSSLKQIVLMDETHDDGRIYFKIVDPDDCLLYSAPDFESRVVGEREYHEIVRGEAVLQRGLWLELHVAEDFDDYNGDRRAYVPLFTAGSEEEREVTCERLSPGEYPKLPQWEKLGFTLKPLGLKPPSNLTQDYGRWKDPSQKHQKDWPFVFKHVIAVSTMLRGTSLAVIDSFVRYHWAIGVNHIFLFFDDAEDPAIQVAKDYAGIAAEDVMDVSLSVFVMNDSWWECAMQKSRFFVRREKSDKYEEVCRGHEKYRDVESRRTIAIDIAILEAHARKVALTRSFLGHGWICWGHL